MIDNGKPSEDSRLRAQKSIQALRARKSRLDDISIDLILRNARSHYAWTDRPVSDEMLRTIYGIAIQGPTSMNTCPARFVFVKSEEGKNRLAKSLKATNIDKMRSAPVTAIVAWDPLYWQRLDFLFPHEDRKALFDGKEDYAHDTAFRNSTLQGAYLMIAARAMGLDVGAMSGFSNAVVDDEFFFESGWKSNFLCNLGYADEKALFQKLPRFEFNDACEVI
ncbi:malonic semialdehyde reductase [Thioalkalivibrio sp. HK1]|uniref:malonic semialdehyde reductase n=1 Tax=Thioalkalivibrio sp. HK1 TaxID=1469245 RepID=UPI000470AB23|nr:malonic semialdehyde reductase [Thioalkalivibrio sp. HK1]